MHTTARWIMVATLVVVHGCSPDRTPKGAKVPEGTPACEEACNTAWPCGGVLENDLAACVANCDDADENDADYRVCIFETECADMADCKVYAPDGTVPEPEDT